MISLTVGYPFLINKDASHKSRVRKIDMTTGIITTIVGTGTSGFIDNVVATSSELRLPQDMTINGNYRIREFRNNFHKNLKNISMNISTGLVHVHLSREEL